MTVEEASQRVTGFYSVARTAIDHAEMCAVGLADRGDITQRIARARAMVEVATKNLQWSDLALRDLQTELEHDKKRGTASHTTTAG